MHARVYGPHGPYLAQHTKNIDRAVHIWLDIPESYRKLENPKLHRITLPEHPTCENLISVSASKPCCVQNVLGTGTTAKPTGHRRGATMQSPHLVDTQVITSDFI